MVLHKILDQYVSPYQRWIKSVIRLGNNEVFKTLMNTLTFVDVDEDTDADANTEGSTIALCKLVRRAKKANSVDPDEMTHYKLSQQDLHCLLCTVRYNVSNYINFWDVCFCPFICVYTKCTTAFILVLAIFLHPPPTPLNSHTQTPSTFYKLWQAMVFTLKELLLSTHNICFHGET